MWWKKKAAAIPLNTALDAKIWPVNAGIWPDGEPQSVRDTADRSNGPGRYDVYMVLVGGFDVYEVLAVFEDRHAARRVAHVYNAAYGVPGDINRWARTEEISFYPAPARAWGAST